VRNIGNRLFDVGVVAALWIFVTGGTYILPAFCRPLADQKPWMHRAVLSALAVLTIVWFYLRRASLRRRGLDDESGLVRAVASLRGVPGILVVGLFVYAGSLWSLSACLRHETFRTGFDMAIFVQAIWNTLHGAFLYSSVKGGVCLLTDHFSPVLALLAVPYACWPDPRCLLLIQALAAASCVFPVYRIAAEVCRSKGWALAFAAAFVLYLPNQNIVRFDFHPEVLAMPLLLWAVDALVRRKPDRASVFLFFALLTKENAALVIFGLAVYAFVFLRLRRFGSFWMILSAAYFTAVVWQIIPGMSGREYFYLRSNYALREGCGWSQVAGRVLNRETGSYLIKIFAPLGFLSFFDAPSFLLNVPMLAQNLLSRNTQTRSIFFQYTALLTPFVFVSAIFGARRFAARAWGIPYLIVCVFLMAGVSEYYVIARTLSSVKAEDPHKRAILRGIPVEASVRANEFLAPHLAHRREIHVYENNHPDEGGSRKARTADYVVVDRDLMGPAAGAEIDALRSQGYEIQDALAGLTVFRKIKS
jgi:uncharacterized membrane protein